MKGQSFFKVSHTDGRVGRVQIGPLVYTIHEKVPMKSQCQRSKIRRHAIR